MKKGFIPVMLTPFKDNGEVDYSALTELTEIYLEAGAAGLFANCLSSEMFELSETERIQTIEHIIKITKGKVPVVATGTFGGPLDRQADFVKRVHDTGTHAVIAITGLLAAETDSENQFNDNVFGLIEKTPGVPLGFYECPVPYKRVLSAKQLGAFVDTGRVIYHKDTCLDLQQIKEKLAVTSSHTSFGLYDAYMVHAVESLKAGSAGLSCIQGNYFPELIVWLCNNYNNPSLEDGVKKVQQFLIDNMDVMHNVYPIVSKYFLQKRGVHISTFTRREVGKVTADIKGQIERLLTQYQTLQSEIALSYQFKTA